MCFGLERHFTLMVLGILAEKQIQEIKEKHFKIILFGAEIWKMGDIITKISRLNLYKLVKWG